MNTVVILLDSLRRDHLGCYGNTWIRTPALDRFAAQCVVFDNAYIGSYPCMPARRDIWTGRYEFPWRGWGALEPDDRDFPGLIRAADRTSMLITDHYHLWEGGSGNYHFNFSGVEFVRGQENDAWITDPGVEVRYPAAPSKLAGHARPGSFARYCRNASRRRSERDYGIAQIAQRAMDWLDANKGLENFCLFLDCFDPHEPFDPPSRYWEMYNQGYEGEHVIWPTYGSSQYLSAEELKQVRALYAGKVTLIDRWVGYLLDHLQSLGLLRNTVVLITTDHGYMLGEHGIIGKPWSAIADSNLYQEVAHVPLLVYQPEAVPRRLDAMVQLVDLFPTVLDALGVPVPNSIHGRSLLPGLLGEEPKEGRYAFFGRFGEAISVTDGEWTLVRWPEGSANSPLYWHSYTPPNYGVGKQLDVVGEREGNKYPVRVARGEQPTKLHNVRRDPWQQRDLALEHPEQRERLKRRLKDWLSEIDAPSEQRERLNL